MRPVFKEFEAEQMIGFRGCDRQSDLRVRQQTLAKMEKDLARGIQKKIQTAGCSFEKAQSELHTEFAVVDQLRESLKKSKTAPRILLDTPTLQALAVELERQNEAIGIFEAEGGFWKHRLRPSVDDILLKAFTGESFSSETKTLGNVHLRSPVLAVCSLVQPDVLQAVYDNTELAGHGATARILPVFLPPQKGNQSNYLTDIPCELIDWYKELIRRLLRINRPISVLDESERTFHNLALSAKAHARIHRYRVAIENQIRNDRFAKLPAFGAKLAGHAARVAGAFHLMTHIEPQLEEINDQSMEAGIAWAEFFRVHATAAFTPEARDGIVYSQRIFDWMKRDRPLTFTEREAHRGIGSGRHVVAQVRAGIDELERSNLLRKYIYDGKVLCVVHPSAYGYFV